MKIKRVPLEYPEIPEDADEEILKAQVRELHQLYCAQMAEIERTAHDMSSQMAKRYHESISEIVNSHGE